LFVYGLLQPGFQPPKVVHRAEPATVKGRLFDLGPFPGAVDIGRGEGVFHGWLLEIDASELADLDMFEDDQGSGQFRRMRTTTQAGQEVWIYEYFGELPEGPALERWPSGITREVTG
jgi:gamma-glutamylcyclotransferase (GGCT)/AIG2-like uncharacterized protein YtfP